MWGGEVGNDAIVLVEREAKESRYDRANYAFGLPERLDFEGGICDKNHTRNEKRKVKRARWGCVGHGTILARAQIRRILSIVGCE